MDIVLNQDDILFYVRVAPKAKKPAVGGKHDGALKVAVSEPPDQGKANAAVVRAVAKRLGLRRADVEIVSGLTSRRKRVRLRNVNAAEVQTQLQQLADDA
ncbi:DUF167 domain-containing protein [Roseimaritima ulvae]|uniref:UPF0235 protein UC8_55180 n=1 Tax=Roseimaritima ulvae TaxID=980254 RepID=A0A5B9QWP0_9BACT|nr:DUF167 family protein [Roseimaritima ulvae]QEG43468.1 hypothetical protein UC8_55180 [Roseimaritima ulvae]